MYYLLQKGLSLKTTRDGQSRQREFGYAKKYIYKDNRIYIREEFRKSLGMNFVSPFQPERKFKVYKSCTQII